MNDTFWLDVSFRWLHILPAMTLFGGALFMRAALHPALDSLEIEARKTLQSAVRARWAKVVMISIGCLLLSGIVNLVLNFSRYKLPPQYHALIGIKILLALAIFFLASVLSGRSALGETFRQKAVMWLNLTLALAVAVVMISGALKLTEHPIKIAIQAANPAESAATK